MKNRLYKKIWMTAVFCCWTSLAFASGTNFNDTTNKPVSSNSPSFTGNVGIGTTTPEGALTVMNGNVGIGTWVPSATLDINGSLQLEGTGNTYFTGNVGISSTSPGKALDVDGAVRMTGFTLTTSPTNGYVLTSDANGNGTWQAAGGGSSQWTTSGSDIYYTTGNVGIGTTKTTTSGLTVMNGNVGIGTWVPGEILDIGGLGNNPSNTTFGAGTVVGIKTNQNNQAGLEIENTSNGSGAYSSLAISTPLSSDLVLQEGGAGNSGTIWGISISSVAEISTSRDLLVGTSGGSPLVFGTNNNERVRIDSSGNVGIGTTTPVGGLAVMNGNVGIGTWVPVNALQVSGNVFLKADSSDSISMNTNGVSINSNTGSGKTAALNSFFVGANNTYADTSFNVYNTGIIGWSPGSDASVSPDTALSRLSVGVVGVGVGTYENSSGVLIAGNIGIGTFNVAGGGLIVKTGNVGIGTWAPREALEVNNNLTYSSMYSNGNSGTALTVNWNNGNNQSVTLTGNVTFTFTAPGGVSRLLLKLIQDGTGSRTATWPGTVEWSGGSAPTLTSTAGAIDFVSCFYDGTDYFCSYSLNFSP